MKILSSISTALTLTLSFSAWGSDDLAAHYGFDGLDVIKVDDGAGPLVTADMNGDGLEDIVVANNRRSRIDIFLQKKDAKPSDEIAATKVNEFPDHWRYRRIDVPTSEAVGAVYPFDFDADGLKDLVYLGNPEKIVFVRQSAPGVFEVAQKHKVKKLFPGRDAIRISNVTGDAAPELLAISDGRIQVYPLTGSTLGAPSELATGNAPIVAMVIEDFNGDSLNDIVGLVPDDAAPIRVWFAASQDGSSVLGPQSRFEMPPVHDVDAVRVPGVDHALIATIERPSKRVVLYDVREMPIRAGTDQGGSMRTWSFTDPSNRKRQVGVADLNGDGLPEVLATNTERNAVSVFPQRNGQGIGAPVDQPSYSDMDAMTTADVDGDGRAEVLVASEREGVAGIARTDASGKLGFPESLPLDKGRVPSTLGVVTIGGNAWIGVITKDVRNYSLELFPAKDPSKGKVSVDLGSLSRAPSAILGLDADQDGLADILLFTPDKPMMMVRQMGTAEGGSPEFKLLESKDMAQFGLAQAAGANNSVALDIDGDGKQELVIADRNYLRALRFASDSGWSVVQQINAPRGDAKLVALDRLGAGLAALDKENGQVLLFAQSGAGAWKNTETLSVGDGQFDRLRAGALSGGKDDALLLIGADAFGVMCFAGTRPRLETLSTWRSDSTDRTAHEFIVGDINGDKMTDVMTLDASEQMLDILTVTQALNLIHATGFEVFETKMFSAGDKREFEPSLGTVADVTGDGAPDVVLLCHDRVLVYPQMKTRAK
ncbi:MAG: VCBS repeat-containing protein [Planctomycetota bacterium]|nr:VCBS repeat-containing protein [Planctomycetota bacterium]